MFLAIPIDQAHEQNNASIKSDGVVGLIDNPRALLRWMAAGPEVTALMEAFEDAHRNTFRNDVCSFINVMESAYLLVFDSKDVTDPSAVKAVQKVHKIGQQQFQTFTKECLLDRTEPMVIQSTTIG